MKFIYKLFLVLLLPNVSNAQYCNIVVTPMDTTICLGDSVLMTAIATILDAGSNQFFNFNASSVPAGWSAGGGTTFGTPCGANPTGTPYYWASTAGSGTPQITTAAFDVTCGGEIIFDMQYSIQSNPSPCEGPDLAEEGVELQYSIDGGITWIAVEYYAPNGTILPNIAASTGPGVSGPTPWTTWSTLTVTIPAAAQTTNTMFRWIQPNSSGAQFDNWGLDNILIFASGLPCNQSAVINWTNGVMDTESYYITPTGDSTFIAMVYDSLGVFQCQSLPINITIFPDVMTYNLIDTVIVYCPTTSPQVAVTNFGGTFGPWGVNWTNVPSTNNPVNLPASNQEHDTTVYFVDITDGCGYLRQDSIVMITNLILEIVSMNSTPTSSCNENTGQVWAITEGLTVTSGQPLYNFTGPNTNPGPINVNGNAMDNLPSGWYYFSVQDNVCSANDSVFVDIIEAPVAQFSANPTNGCAPFDVQFTNSSQNATNYLWDFGNGNTLPLNTLDSQNQTYSNTSTIFLVAYASDGCTDTAQVTVTVVTCGCIDPDAVNYDPNAQVSDGSCVYPTPVVIAPNVFTPNGDDINNLFFLDTKWVGQLELIIVNRWGNVMYSGNANIALPGAIVGWDGRAQNGSDAEAGTYFYTYKATALFGDETVEGHGFLQLVR